MSSSNIQTDAYKDGGGGIDPAVLDLYVKKDTAGAAQNLNTDLIHNGSNFIKEIDFSEEPSKYQTSLTDKDGAETYPTLIRFSEKLNLVSEGEQLVKDDALQGLYKSFKRIVYRFLKNDGTTPIISNFDYYYDSVLGRAVYKDSYGEFARIGGTGNGAQILTTFQTFDATIANSQANNSGSTSILNVVSFTPKVNTGEVNSNGVYLMLPNLMTAGNTIQASVFEENLITKDLTCIVKAQKLLTTNTQGFVLIPNTSVLANASFKVGYIYWIYASTGTGGVLAGFSGAINAGSPQGDAGLSLGAVTSALALTTGQTISSGSRMNGTGRIWSRIV